jgi:hypothetical protein
VSSARYWQVNLFFVKVFQFSENLSSCNEAEKVGSYKSITYVREMPLVAGSPVENNLQRFVAAQLIRAMVNATLVLLTINVLAPLKSHKQPL